MPDTHRVLGQQAPAAATLTTLYTVPVNTQTVSSTLTVCNRSATAGGTFRVAVSPGGAAVTNAQWIYHDATVAAATTVAVRIGMTLGAGDIVRVQASTADFSFNLFGVEITP